MQSGWKLILAYTKHLNDSQQPHFVVAWKNDETPVIPELLDDRELHEMEINMQR